MSDMHPPRVRGAGHRRRRRPTRWLLLVPVVSLAVIVAGAVWLEASHPQLAPPRQRGMLVEDLPAFALDEARTCVRGTDDELAAELRERFPAGGRVSSTQVYRCPLAFDGAQVTFIGEAIGELLPRDDGAWLQVNDDAYALEVGPLVGHRERVGFNRGLSVWLPDGLHEQVDTFGRSAQRGDVLEVRGTIHRADPDDGGGLTLRADDLEVRAEGVAVEPPLHRAQAVVAAVLAVLAIAAMVWARLSRRR